MTSIEKTTIPITKVAAIVGTVVILVANYYTTVNAVKEGIADVKNETKLEIQDLHNEDKLIRAEISTVKAQTNEMKDAIVSYIGTGLKPEEPEFKRKR